ncbi:MAG: hypothetical protein KAG84_04230 [Bacteroidales bacterium]|nr:hypothetical protein [Bacteroidales bacterium]
MIRKILVLAIVIVFFSQNISAQMDCRSMLGAHLTPFKKDVPILWGIEATVAPGIMSSPYDSLGKTLLNGGMLLAALDFGFGEQKHHIYLEGGYKNWVNSEFVAEDSAAKSKHFGLRQAFYSYTNDKTKIKLGLHETRLGDFFLVDERVLGASIDHEIGAFTLNARVGTVSTSFARMGKFCANRHLYSIINPNYTENIGNKIGETNMAGFVINWNPHYEKENSSSTNSDEFSEDDEFTNSSDEFHENHDFNEFGDTDDFSNEDDQSKYKVRISNIGLVFYDEFGSDKYIPDNKLYTGALVDLNLPFDFFLQTGGIYQNMKNNDAVVYIAKFGKSKSWENASLTKLSGAFIGKYDIDDNARFQPLFSNLFIGEVVRMDAAEFPLWQIALKHRFPGKMKFHFAIKAVGQIEDAKTNEQDIEVGALAFNKHLKITLIGSRIETLLLPKEFYMARVELRLAF